MIREEENRRKEERRKEKRRKEKGTKEKQREEKKKKETMHDDQLLISSKRVIVHTPHDVRLGLNQIRYLFYSGREEKK